VFARVSPISGRADFCPPVGRSPRLRKDLGFGFGLLKPSEDGGLLEFRLLIASRASNSVTFN
jgi:hypothetical protein